MPVIKKCCTCKEEKSLREFYRQSCGLFGRTGSCKSCRLKKVSEYNKTTRGKELSRENAKKT